VKSPVFATEVLPHPLFLTVCDTVLLPHCARYQLNLAHVLVRGPGAEAQALHRDQDAWSHLPKPHPEVQLASIIALVDFTADNGATCLIPGSHRWPPVRSAEDHELVTAEMPAGSAVIYLGSTAHGGGPNVTTDEWRRGIHISYSAGWLRSAENQFLLNPVESVRCLPRVTQELLGYAAHDAIDTGGGYIGTVDLQDPIELIDAGAL
jgi:ectoine hydroxylase-related dioxygenase (phytanoyl-CoA dioxygenase family)